MKKKWIAKKFVTLTQDGVVYDHVKRDKQKGNSKNDNENQVNQGWCALVKLNYYKIKLDNL